MFYGLIGANLFSFKKGFIYPLIAFVDLTNRYTMNEMIATVKKVPILRDSGTYTYSAR